ncbi:uncharacterized protein V1513DRAFT_436188 [Lipomyces chichibuensis]|uniref:uncharacterized protein n=1 Tax=Lipomyces chichibuensis TaxID=1546026 RepID=UPI003343F8C5
MSFLFKALSVPGLQDMLAFGFPLEDLVQNRIVTPTVTATTLDTGTIPVRSWKLFNVISTGSAFALAAGTVRAVANFVAGGWMYPMHPATSDISNRPDLGKSRALVLYTAFWDIVKYEQPKHTYSQTCHSLSRLHRMLVHSRHMLYGMPTPYLYTRHRLLSCHRQYRIRSAASSFTLRSLTQVDGEHSLLSHWNIPDLDGKPSTQLHIIGDSYKFSLGSNNGDRNDGDAIFYSPHSNPWLTHNCYQMTDGTDTSETCHLNNAISNFDQPHRDPIKGTPSDDVLHIKTPSMIKRHRKYLYQADADSKCRSSIGIRSRRAPFVPVDPNQTQASPSSMSFAKLSEYLQQVKTADSLFAPDSPGSDTDLDSIFDSDETYTDSSPPDSPSCDPWIVDYFDSEKESRQPQRRGEQASKTVEPVRETPLTLKQVHDKNSVHNLLPTPSLSPRKAANIDIISADVEKVTNVEPQRDDENKLELPLTHFAPLLSNQRLNNIPPAGDEIPEGISASQIYASISGFMFRHIDTIPGLRRVFETRDHRRGSKYLKEEVKIMYDTITRHRGCDEQSIADLVVHAVYSWRGDR